MFLCHLQKEAISKAEYFIQTEVIFRGDHSLKIARTCTRVLVVQVETFETITNDLF